MEIWKTTLIRERIDGDDLPMRGPSDVVNLFRTLYPNSPQEMFVVFALNVRNRIIGTQMITLGTADSSLVHPREVFRAAILSNASAIMLAHNHPSGDPSPSPEDRSVTRQLVDAGRTVGIPIIDHVIVCDESYYSFGEEGNIL